MVNYAGNMIAIIPARRGSKRLPGKNLLPLAGKPLIQWTIDAAINSGVFDQVVITSDEEELLSEDNFPGTVKIKRPSKLATDTATTADVILHTLETLNIRSYSPNKFMLLQPTSPLRSAADIRLSIHTMLEKKSDSIISICPAEHPPMWFGKLDKDEKMHNFLDVNITNKRSQDLGDFYRLNGAIYCAHVEKYKKEMSFFMENSHGYIMPVERSVDIDSEFDFFLAESIIKYYEPS